MVNLNDNDFKCEICMENFNVVNRKPNSLVPCGHTFCVMCLEHIGNSLCPTCRVEIQNIIPNWEIIKRLDNSVPSQQTMSRPPQPLNTQVAKIRTCCSQVSEHFYALSTKRKLLFIYTIFILLPVFLIYPVALLYIGIQHVYGECAMNYLIPIWMVVYGGNGILTVVFAVILALFLILKFPEAKITFGFLSAVLGLFAFFELIWFFVGTVWIFGAYPIVSYDQSSSNYCQPALFKFAFGTLITQCIVFGIFVCISPCVLCCCWGKLSRNRRS